MTEVGGEDYCSGLHLARALTRSSAELPTALRSARQGIDAGVEADIDTEAAR